MSRPSRPASRSCVCLEALARAADIRVVVAEARPLLEGRRLARQLAAAGVPTTVCTDAAIGTVIGASAPLEAVVVGADAVAPEWFVNKCGTHQLITAASALGIPTYVVASRDKFINGLLGASLSLNEGPPGEVWENPPEGVTVVNPYFEQVPVDVVATFVTDAGPVGPASVSEVCRSTVTALDSPRLVELLET